jgi:hypothetical protein
MAIKRQWKEAELVQTFNLDRITEYKTPLMQEWLDVNLPVFTDFEQYSFNDLYSKAVKNIAGWSEEDLKMKFLSFLLQLGNMTDEGQHKIRFN